MNNLLPNGLTLLQINPDCAVQLDPNKGTYGWLYVKGAQGQWVTHRQLSKDELEQAFDQEADGHVIHGTKARQA